MENYSSGSIAVLASGGLDSAILVGDLARSFQRVQPIYVRFGLFWEDHEEAGLRKYLRALDSPVVSPLKVFSCPLKDVYGEHWSTSGRETPSAETEDSAVFLPGRNLLLFSQSAIWCHLQGISSIALGVLCGNPFADATEEYFETFQRAVNLALGANLQFLRPYRHLTKTSVLQRGQDLPLEETISCIHPTGGFHCGQCNKCAERQKAFAEAGFPDPTLYMSVGSSPRSPSSIEHKSGTTHRD